MNLSFSLQVKCSLDKAVTLLRSMASFGDSPVDSLFSALSAPGSPVPLRLGSADCIITVISKPDFIDPVSSSEEGAPPDLK